MILYIGTIFAKPSDKLKGWQKNMKYVEIQGFRTASAEDPRFCTYSNDSGDINDFGMVIGVRSFDIVYPWTEIQ